jgi:hypothetical protein
MHQGVGWTRHLVYRAEVTRTTWKLRIGFVVFVLLLLRLTSGWWTVAIARSLVCDASVAPSDAILVETFDLNFSLFERAADLRHAGLAGRVLVPLQAESTTQEPKAITVAVMELMAARSGLGPIELVPVREVEPITLNATRDVQHFLEREHIRSIIVVTSLLRSRRSALVYAATLGRAGIEVRYQPVGGPGDLTDWSRSWHGIQNVLQQWFKLQYYRVYVLPAHRNVGNETALRNPHRAPGSSGEPNESLGD